MASGKRRKLAKKAVGKILRSFGHRGIAPDAAERYRLAPDLLPAGTVTSNSPANREDQRSTISCAVPAHVLAEIEYRPALGQRASSIHGRSALELREAELGYRSALKASDMAKWEDATILHDLPNNLAEPATTSVIAPRAMHFRRQPKPAGAAHGHVDRASARGRSVLDDYFAAMRTALQSYVWNRGETAGKIQPLRAASNHATAKCEIFNCSNEKCLVRKENRGCFTFPVVSTPES